MIDLPITLLKNAELVNFGSGPSAYDFDYERSGVNGFNFGMAPSCFALEKLLLCEVGKYINKGCAAAFAVCPFSFAKNNGYENDRRFLCYYGVLSENSLKNAPKRLLRYNAELKNEIGDEVWFPYGIDFSHDAVSKTELDRRTENMIGCWKSQMDLTDFCDEGQALLHKEAFENERNDMISAISKALELGLRPFLVLPPLYKGLRDRISPRFFEVFVYDNIKNLPSGVKVLDYTASEIFSCEDFSDCVFLNREGAKKFTLSVLNDTK